MGASSGQTATGLPAGFNQNYVMGSAANSTNSSMPDHMGGYNPTQYAAWKASQTAPAATTAPSTTSTAASTAPAWNVNTAASQGLQSAMNTSAAGQNFYSPAMAGAYMNPYQQNVIGGLVNQAGQNYQTAANQLGAEATAAKAFGGSRHGVAQGQMAADIQNNLNQQVGNLMYSGYNNALSQAQADQAARMGASSQLANQANLGFGMGQQINNQMMVQGAMQQALQQMAMDKAAGQYAQYQQSPYTALSAMTSAIGGTPYNQASTQTTNQSTQRGLFDYLALLA